MLSELVSYAKKGAAAGLAVNVCCQALLAW